MVDGEEQVCWRVEAIDTFSTPGIIEVNAVEYYANPTEDDLENGIVGALKTKPIDPTPPDPSGFNIIGDTFIKPSKEYIYYIDSSLYGQWYIANEDKVPIVKEVFEDEQGRPAIKIKWKAPYSGQFDLWYGDEEGPLMDY